MMASTEQGKTRSVPMEVLVLGQCRTGTQSLSVALSQLGYPGVYHMRDVVANPDHALHWRKAFVAKFEEGKPWGREEWDQLLGDSAVLTDLPPAAFPEELIKAYPSAKVILSIRDEDKWFESVASTIWKSWKLNQAPPGPFRDMAEKMHQHLWKDDFESHGREYFRQQNDLVRKLMADRPGDFLEYNVKEGWAPLCQFLGKDVPQQEFPHNDVWTQFKQDPQSFPSKGQPALSGVAAASA